MKNNSKSINCKDKIQYKNYFENNTLIFRLLLLLSFVFWQSNNVVLAQQLEPRSITNVPAKMNFVVASYGYSWGNTLLDASIPIEDLNSKVHGFVAAYARSIDFFGMSSKIDVVIPYAIGDWDGYLEGTYATASRSGFGDPRFRFSFNFLGSPSLDVQKFGEYKPQTIAGFSIQVFTPLGQYFEDKLINLGANRWTFKPQFGIAKYFGKWIIEGYVSAWFYTANNEFTVTNKLKQEPLFAVKTHLIRSLPKKMWIAFDIGYGFGGKTALNDVLRDDRISTIRLGATYAVPVSKKSTLKFSYYSAIRLEKGADYDALAVSYQYRWF